MHFIFDHIISNYNNLSLFFLHKNTCKGSMAIYLLQLDHVIIKIIVNKVRKIKIKKRRFIHLFLLLLLCAFFPSIYLSIYICIFSFTSTYNKLNCIAYIFKHKKKKK